MSIKKITFTKWMLYMIAALPASILIYYPMKTAMAVCDAIDKLFIKRDKPKIIMLTDDFPPTAGGIQTYCYELAKNTNELSDDIIVMAPKNNGWQEFDREQDFNIIRISLPTNNYLKIAVMCLNLGYQYLKYRPDIILSMAWFPVGIVTYLLRVKYIMYAYALEILTPQERSFNHNLMLRVYNRSQKIIAISSYTKTILLEKGIKPDLIEVVPVGVDYKHFTAHPRNDGHTAHFHLKV